MNICPDGGEQGQERREALETVWQLTDRLEEISPTRNNRDYTFDTRRENGFTGTGLSRLETPGGQFDPRERDLSWDYSDAAMSYEGRYLVVTSGPDGNTVVTRRRKTRRNRCRYKTNSTQTLHGNKTAVSVHKGTQMTPRKATTSIGEGISEGINGSIIQTTKTGSEKKKKKKLFEYDKARLCPAMPGLTEEEMLGRGPIYKDCKKGHYGQVCPCNKCGWIHPNHGCPERPFTPEDIPTITEVPPEGVEPKTIKLTLPIEGMEWCWLCGLHGPKEICPRRDEINTEFGCQRLKELLQQIVKAEGKGTVIIDKIPGVEEEINFLGTPPFPVPDKNQLAHSLYSHQRERNPMLNQLRWGGGPQWPSKPSTNTPVRGTGGTKGQPPGKPTKGVPSNVSGEGNRNQGEDQPPPRPPPRDDGGGGRNGDGNGNGGSGGDDDDDDEGDDED